MVSSQKHAGSRRPRVRVVVVDDHPLVRRMIRRFLESESGFVVCDEASTCDEAHRAAIEHHPDILLLDLELGTDNGFRVIGTLGAMKPPVPVLVVSLHSESLYASLCVDQGARGYLMKIDAPDHLVDAIECILGGEIYFSRAMQHALRAS